jgi:hypothetical protein
MQHIEYHPHVGTAPILPVLQSGYPIPGVTVVGCVYQNITRLELDEQSN